MKRKPETDSPLPPDCALTRARLPLFAGGDLEGPALVDVQAHLAECDSCAGEAAEAARMRGLFVAVLADRAADLRQPGLWPDVRARLVEEGILEQGTPVLPFTPTPSTPVPAASRGAGPSSTRLRLVPGRRMRRLASLTAAAAAIIFLVVLADPFGLREDGDSIPFDGNPAPVVVITPAPGPPAERSGLRRISAEDEELLRAADLESERGRLQLRPGHPSGVPTGQPGAALAGDSRRRGIR